MEMKTLTSGSGKAAVQSPFKFTEEIHHACVVEGQHLREDGPRNMLDWINPEIAIEKSCPTGTAGTSAVGPWQHIDVKRQSPLKIAPDTPSTNQ
jgi:hypothetical protein